MTEIIFETDRLILTKLSLADAPFMLRLLNEPSFIKNIGDRKVRTIEDAQAYVMSFPIASYEQFGFGPYLAHEKETGVAVGICGLRKRDSFDAPDIGYALLPEYCGRGYAYEASKGLMTYSRNTLGLDRLYGLVNQDNVASIRLLEKLGFAFLRMVLLDGERVEIKLYGSELKGD